MDNFKFLILYKPLKILTEAYEFKKIYKHFSKIHLSTKSINRDPLYKKGTTPNAFEVALLYASPIFLKPKYRI